MAGFSLFRSISASLRRKKLEKQLQLAKSWPIIEGEVLDWKAIPADDEVASFQTPEQLEARFYFTLNGEYYGGHFRSVGLSKSEIRSIGEGTPLVNIRYDPQNPDANIVLPEDNASNLPFRVLPS